jgi:hypothetical protein
MPMFGSTFYHQTLRKYVIAFGNMFNDMTVSRLDEEHNTIQTLAVPISYSPKEKWLARIRGNPDLTSQVQTVLPRLAFEITGFEYDGSRRLPSTTRNVAISSTDSDILKYQRTPVPWNLNFSLYSYVRNADDGVQIMEQILPYFGPEWTNKINLIPEMGIKLDVPTILTGMSIEDSYEGDYENRRALIQSFNFTMKCWFFGPVRTSSEGGIIKRTIINLSAMDIKAKANTLYGITVDITDEELENVLTNSRVTIQPGLYANGVGTTNSAASINPNLIQANSAWKYAPNTFFYPSGVKYNPVTGQDT